MRIGLKNIIISLLMFGGGALYFFAKSVQNTRGLIINGIFKLNVTQACIFYFVMGVICIFILILCGVALYLKNRKGYV